MILHQAKGGVPVALLRRQHGISDPSFYRQFKAALPINRPKTQRGNSVQG
jgi:hypothetical protein